MIPPGPTGLMSAQAKGGRLLKSIIANNDLVRTASDKDQFCSFCVLESFVKQSIVGREVGAKTLIPLSVIILISKLSDHFRIGLQADAQEFLLLLLENLIQSSFGYHQNVEYKMQSQSFIPQIFQGRLERQIICCSCNHIKTI